MFCNMLNDSITLSFNFLGGRMTKEEFRKWLIEMRANGLATSDKKCGELIGVTESTMLRYKAHGASYTVAMACKSALEGLSGYR